MNKKILFILISLVLISGCNNEIEERDNEQTMKRICDNNYGGEPYLYKVGWSETCGFDIYRGTCVSYGRVLDPSGYLLIDGTSFSMDEIEDMLTIDEGPMDDEELEELNQWRLDVCKKFSEVRDE